MDFSCLSVVIDGLQSEIKVSNRKTQSMKGKIQKIKEQEETRNWARYDSICDCWFKRPNAIIGHFQDFHDRDGFICANCKMGVAIAAVSEHGFDICDRVPTMKKNKETKKEKKEKKKQAREVRGYVTD